MKRVITKGKIQNDFFPVDWYIFSYKMYYIFQRINQNYFILCGFHDRCLSSFFLDTMIQIDSEQGPVFAELSTACLWRRIVNLLLYSLR